MDNRLFEALTRIRDALESLDIGWALVGGLAFSALIEPRTTRDVDLVVAVNKGSSSRQMTRPGYRML